MKLNTIMVGIDFSTESEQARQHALYIANQADAEVILAHASEAYRDQSSSRGAGDYRAARYEDKVRAEVAHSRRQLEQLGETSRGQWGRVAPLFIDAHPDPGLAKVANELRVDLVVVGTHGRRGVSRFLLGSVAERTVRLAETNVMVARGAPPQRGGYRRILVPTDFSDSPERALALAAALTRPGGEILLFHAWRTPMAAIRIPIAAGIPGAAAPHVGVTVADQHDNRVRAEISEAAMAAAHTLIARHRSDDHDIQFRQVEGRAKDEILAELDSGRYDLCVMGSHGKRGVRRLLLGSTSEMTVRYAPCSVIVTR